MISLLFLVDVAVVVGSKEEFMHVCLGIVSGGAVFFGRKTQELLTFVGGESSELIGLIRIGK